MTSATPGCAAGSTRCRSRRSSAPSPALMHQVGTTRKIDRNQGTRLVQRHQGIAEAADADLNRPALAQRSPNGQRGVLDRGWESTSRSPPVRTKRSKPPCLPNWDSMWSKNGTPVSMSVVPVPSSSNSTTTVPSVARSTRGAGHPSASTSAVRNASFSAGVPMLARSQPARPVRRTRTPESSSERQTDSRIGEHPK